MSDCPACKASFDFDFKEELLDKVATINSHGSFPFKSPCCQRQLLAVRELDRYYAEYHLPSGETKRILIGLQ